MPHSTLFSAALIAALVFTPASFAQTKRYESAVFEKVAIESDVVFHTSKNIKGEHEALKLDIYRPAGDTVRHRPAIVWFHGGGFRPGNDKKQRYVVTMSNAFAQRGYVCISADYRVREQPGQGPERLPVLKDAVEDGQAALAWVRSHASELGIDPQQIAVGGGSAGGSLATSLVAIENTAAVKNRTPKLFAYVNLWGSPTEEFMLAKVDEHYPPTVIVHGTADQSVPFANSEALVTRLRAQKIPHELMAIQGAPHTPTAHADAFIKVVSAFVLKALPRGRN